MGEISVGLPTKYPLSIRFHFFFLHRRAFLQISTPKWLLRRSWLKINPCSASQYYAATVFKQLACKECKLRDTFSPKAFVGQMHYFSFIKAFLTQFWNSRRNLTHAKKVRSANVSFEVGCYMALNLSRFVSSLDIFLGPLLTSLFVVKRKKKQVFCHSKSAELYPTYFQFFE